MLNAVFALVCLKLCRLGFRYNWVKINKDTVTLYQRQKCSPVTLVSGNVMFVRIFADFSGKKASNDHGARKIFCRGMQTPRPVLQPPGYIILCM